VPVLLLTAWSLVGCYRHIPVELGPTDQISGHVRILLRPAGTESVRFILGERVHRIDALVERTSNDSLYLRAESSRSLSGQNTSQHGVVVAVARADVLSLDAREPHKGRTLLMVAGVAAALVLVVASWSSGVFGASDGGTDGPPDITRIPVTGATISR